MAGLPAPATADKRLPEDFPSVINPRFQLSRHTEGIDAFVRHARPQFHSVDQGAKHFRRFVSNVRIVQRFLEPLDLLGINVGSGRGDDRASLSQRETDAVTRTLVHEHRFNPR